MCDCIKDLKEWMIRHQLKLNDDNTEFLLIGTKHQLETVNFSSITVCDALIAAKSKVRNLGSWFDSHLNMSIHISKICASAFYHLYNIGRIRKILSLDATKAVVHAFVRSHVHYCNSLLYGLPAIQINKVQHVLNAAARLVSHALRYCHAAPLLRELHCLLVRQRINYKIVLLKFKTIHGKSPIYLQKLISVKLPGAYRLSSSSNGLLLEAPSLRNRATLGDRSFQVVAPKLWNALPHEINLLYF